MKVLVTGAAGFLGTHLTNALTARGDEVFALYRTLRPHPLRFDHVERITQLLGDVQDPVFVRRIVAQYGVEAIVHLAAQTQVSVGVEAPDMMFRENVAGALSVLEAARQQKVCPRVIIASTDKVYGSESIPYTEDTRLAERTPYGASKVCVDVIAQTYEKTYKMPVAITRCGNLYGPGHMNFSTLIPGTIRRFFRGEKAVVKFGGNATRDFLYVHNAVDAYLMLLDKPDHYGPFNFSGGKEFKIIDVVQGIATLMGKGPADIEVTPGNPHEIVCQRLSCERAQNWLNWHPMTSFQDGLRRTVEWYKRYLTSETGSTSSGSCSPETRSGALKPA
jgi:CDP-glucose 4,6-dehydratase